VMYQAKSRQYQTYLVKNDKFKIEMEQINQQAKSVCNLAEGHYRNTLDINEIRRLSISTEPNGMKNILKNKLKNLIKSLSDEEMIDLDDAIKNSAQTEIDTSFCSSLRDEIEMIVRDSKNKN
jgi:hypothetical protein